MVRLLAFIFFLLLVLICISTSSKADTVNDRVDHQLIISIDISSSMDNSYLTQIYREYANALRDPEVSAAIESGYYKKIAVSVHFWSSFMDYATDWIVVDVNNVHELADMIENSNIPAKGTTSIGRALIYARDMFLESEIRATRRSILIIGDGKNNTGIHPDAIAKELYQYLKVTISGVALAKTDDSTLINYYARHISIGDFHFSMEATRSQDFKESLMRSILQERYRGYD